MYGNNNKNPNPGQPGGPCRRVGSGQLGMPCNRGLKCTTSGDLGVPRCMPMNPAPGPRPAPSRRPSLGQQCLTGQQFPGSGLRGNCQNRSCMQTHRWRYGGCACLPRTQTTFRSKIL